MEPSDRPDPRTVLVRMRAALPDLRQSEQRVARLFLDDPATAANRSVAELAEQGGVSTASVVRFYKRMGYERYKDLRIDLTREATRERIQHANLPMVSGDIDRDDTVEDIVAKVAMAETLSIADTAEVLDRGALSAAIDLVLAARRVDSFGMGASSFVGLDFQQKLARVGRVALNWTDTHSAWTSAATLDASCVALGVSHSGATPETVEFLAGARAAGAATIALTNHGGSVLTAQADVVLLTAARETQFRSGALGSRIAQLMVLDCLFLGVARASYDDSMAALRRTYAAVHGAGRG